jgi:6-pyruvoyltetrahydropterin/6-carboxytetrahydropterin synthase
VHAHVVDKVDHRNLNLEVDFLRDTIPTTENVVVAFWRVLEPALRPAQLTRLVLWETVNNYVEYDGR